MFFNGATDHKIKTQKFHNIMYIKFCVKHFFVKYQPWKLISMKILHTKLLHKKNFPIYSTLNDSIKKYSSTS